MCTQSRNSPICVKPLYYPTGSLQASPANRAFFNYFSQAEEASHKQSRNWCLATSSVISSPVGRIKRESNTSSRRILPWLLHDTLFLPIGPVQLALCQSHCQKRRILSRRYCATALPLRLSAICVSFELSQLSSMAEGDMLLPKLCILLLTFP